jgi:hypothetical protein
MAPVVRGNSLYTIVDGPSWTQAEANAVKLGGHLTAITSQEENDFVASFSVQGLEPKSGNFAGSWGRYIGLTDVNKEGLFSWVNGENLNYQNWYPNGEPNSYSSWDAEKSDFVEIFPVDNIGINGVRYPGRWNDSYGQGENSTTGIAEIPFIRRGDSAYVIVPGPTWEEAEANAVKLGGHLVTINDAAENEWVFKNIASQLNVYIWLGGTDRDNEGVWKWVDGAPWDYTNWNRSQPDDSGGEDYLQFCPNHPDFSNTWNDNSNNILGFPQKTALGIAEIKLAPNNAPTGTPSITGTSKVGSTITIDAATVKDADNFTGYTPTYNYSFEVSNDNGVTWTKLTSIDATDNNTTYTLATAEVGKQVRGIVSYLDGYGTNEAVNSVSSVVLPNNPPTQEVFTHKTQIAYTPSKSVTVPLQYKTSAGDSQLSGLTLNVHYNSSILAPISTNNGVSDQLPVSITTNKIVPDTNNLDNDPLTDKIIQLVWATFDNTFPNKTLPATLANLTFNTSSTTTDSVTGAPVTTNLRYTASATAAGYDFLTNYTTLKATSFNLDVDGDGQVKPLTDGLMIIRKLLGPAFDADALTFKAIGSGATRTTAEIHDFIQSGIDGGMLDIDKNGKTAPLTDGLMVIRRLLGPAFDGDALTFKALASDSPYFGKSDAPALVSANIDSLRSF